MGKFSTQFLIEIFSILGSGIGGALGMINDLLKSGFRSATQFHQEGIAFSRELGLNAREAQAYTQVLTDRTEKLAIKYGVAAEQVKELQKNISIATSRQLMLNDSQAEGFLQLNKLVGSSTVSKFTEEIMNGMGGQLETVQGAVAKAYASASKSGLSAQKVSEKIANNLSMANRLSFRTGIEGLTRMAIQAEKMGMSLQSVESMANSFIEIDDAIEHAARLQMLGGAAGSLGANPLDLAYEANNDPEALQKRMIGMLSGYASFDAKTGMANINGINMDFVRNIAKAMGISADEASKIAKKNAEVRYKESAMNKAAYKSMGYTDEQIDFLINKSNVKNGKVMFTDIKGKEHELNGANGKIDSKILEEMMKYEGMSDRDIMEENAQTLTSINEKLKGIGESIAALFAKFLNGLFPDLVKDVGDLGKFFKDNLEPAARNLGASVREIVKWVMGHKETIKNIAEGIGGLLKWITSMVIPVLKWIGEWPKTSAAIIAAIWASKSLGLGGLGKGGFGRSSGGAVNSIGNTFNRAKNFKKGSGFWDGMFGRASSMHKGKNGLYYSKGRSGALSNNYVKYAKLGKLARYGGGAAIIGTIGDMAVEGLADNGVIEKGGMTHKLSAAGTRALSYGGTGAMIGGTLGSFVPVIGNAVGAAVGGAIGGIWGGISGYLDAKEIGDTAAKSAARVPHDEGGFINGVVESGFVKNGSKGAEAPITKTDTAYQSEVVLNPTQQKNFMALANGETTNIKAKPVGEKEYIYTPRSSQTSNVNGNTITVKDFNINLSGTLKLDGGRSSSNIDANELLRDHEFMTALKNMIKQSINQDINGGRFMNDIATVAGFPSQTSIYAK